MEEWWDVIELLCGADGGEKCEPTHFVNMRIAHDGGIKVCVEIIKQINNLHGRAVCGNRGEADDICANMSYGDRERKKNGIQFIDKSSSSRLIAALAHKFTRKVDCHVSKLFGINGKSHFQLLGNRARVDRKLNVKLSLALFAHRMLKLTSAASDSAIVQFSFSPSQAARYVHVLIPPDCWNTSRAFETSCRQSSLCVRYSAA